MQHTLCVPDIALSVLDKVENWMDFLACRRVCKRWCTEAEKVLWQWYRAYPYMHSPIGYSSRVRFCGSDAGSCKDPEHIRDRQDRCWGKPWKNAPFAKTVPIHLQVLRSRTERRVKEAKANHSYAERRVRETAMQLRFATEAYAASKTREDVCVYRLREAEKINASVYNRVQVRLRRRAIPHYELSMQSLSKRDEGGQRAKEAARKKARRAGTPPN